VATLQQQATASQQQVARLQAAVTQLQAVVATMPSTIPANLTALSNAHSTNGGVSLTGAITFIYSPMHKDSLALHEAPVNGWIARQPPNFPIL